MHGNSGSNVQCSKDSNGGVKLMRYNESHMHAVTPSPSPCSVAVTRRSYKPLDSGSTPLRETSLCYGFSFENIKIILDIAEKICIM
jgi:hypothetical protein